MKVVFERQHLASAMGLVQNLVNANTTMPILSNVLLEVEGERATLTATDLESFGRVQIEARVEEAGRTAIQARLLGDIVRRLPEADVTLETTDSGLDLRCARDEYRLPTMPAEDYPSWPKMEPETRMTLQQADLKRLLHNTMFAIPVKDPRKVLMGVLFDLAEGKLIGVATDGRKLGKTVIEPLEVVGEAACQVIVPRAILDNIDAAIGDSGEIEMGVTTRQVMFSFDSVSYISSRIEGKYPEYTAVIPDSFKETVRIPKTALADAIGRAAVVAEHRHHSIKFVFGRDCIDLTSQSFSEGSYEGRIDGIEYSGEAFQIAFNHQFLGEIFRIIPDPLVDVHIRESASPVVFTCESDPDTLYLIMPVRMADLSDEGKMEPESQS